MNNRWTGRSCRSLLARACGVAALAVGSLAQAQPAPLPGAALRAGFDAAWARQPEQHSQALRRDAALAAQNASQRWTPEPPALELGVKSDRFHEDTGSREIEAALSMPLWLAGERAGTRAAATAELGAAEARHAAARLRIAGEVREAYWAHALAGLDVQLARQQLANATALGADVARRVTAGDLARADGHQAESSVAAAESALAHAGIALSQAAQRWRALTGLTALAVTGDDATAAPAEAPPAMVASAPAHPAVQDLQARAEVARRQHDLARVQTRAHPELTLATTRERGAAGERYGQSLTVGVRIPLGRSSGSPARMALAAAEQAEAEAQLALEQARVASDVEAASARIAALQTAQAAGARRARLASERRDFIEKSFRLGESDLATRLRAELDATEAERQSARSRVELAAALSALRQALGLLPE